MTETNNWQSVLIENADLLTPHRLEQLQQRYPHVETMGQLAALSDLDLIRIPKFGRRTISRVREAIASERWQEALPSEEEVRARRAGFPADIWAVVERLYERSFFPPREAVAQALLDERVRATSEERA